MPGDDTAGRGWALVGDIRPGGLNANLVGDGGRPVAGVVGLEFRMLDAGRSGGPITTSRVAALDALLLVGEGEGGMLDKVSKVLSVKEGLGLRFPRSKVAFAAGSGRLVEFSSPSSKTAW